MKTDLYVYIIKKRDSAMSPFVMLTKSRFYVNTDYIYALFLANKTERKTGRHKYYQNQ